MDADEPCPLSPARIERARRAIRKRVLAALAPPRGPEGSGHPRRDRTAGPGAATHPA